MKFKHKKNKSTSDIILVAICYLVGTSFAILCLAPLIYLVSGSLSSEALMLRGNLKLIPTGFTTLAYKTIFSGDQIFKCYGVSIGTTVVGTIASLVFSSFFAYPLSTGRLKYGSKINLFIYFTMIFSGGLVPTFLWYTQGLHLANTYQVLILPSLLIPWNMFLLRNFFKAIPASLAESARIDGCGEPSILFRIILPCSKPALATVGLFYALGYWNEWYRVMLYNSADRSKWTLQFQIMKMMNEIATIKAMAAQGVSIEGMSVPTTTMKLATAVCTIGPIVLAYPFAQKYFTSGILVGSVKE
ncbi:MAG: carbohydrate ABC transporter permease [Anaerocolumna sp.]